VRKKHLISQGVNGKDGRRRPASIEHKPSPRQKETGAAAGQARKSISFPADILIEIRLNDINRVVSVNKGRQMIVLYNADTG
jgi:hypothetical protein